MATDDMPVEVRFEGAEPTDHGRSITLTVANGPDGPVTYHSWSAKELGLPVLTDDRHDPLIMVGYMAGASTPLSIKLPSIVAFGDDPDTRQAWEVYYTETFGGTFARHLLSGSIEALVGTVPINRVGFRLMNGHGPRNTVWPIIE